MRDDRSEMADEGCQNPFVRVLTWGKEAEVSERWSDSLEMLCMGLD